MKTQISNLINGRQDVIRDDSHAKYLTAPRAASHVGYAGTSRALRSEIAQRVYEENGDTLRINVRGITLSLEIYRSCSGKTWYWQTSLTAEQYKVLAGSSLGIGKNFNYYTLTVNGDCTLEISVFHRINERRTWHLGYTHNIDEAFITIL